MSGRRGLLRHNTPEMEAALEAAWTVPGAPKPLCDNRPEFTDYSGFMPAEVAEAMCEGCPFVDYIPVENIHLPDGQVMHRGAHHGNICRRNARLMKPGWGVFGGEAWDMGKRVALQLRVIQSEIAS